VSRIVAHRSRVDRSQIIGNVEPPRTVAIGDPRVIAVDPHRAVGSRNRRETTHRPPTGGGLLQHALDGRPEPEANRERVVGDAGPSRHDRQRRAHRLEISEPGADLVDEMRARRTQPSSALRRVEPPSREPRFRIGHQADDRDE
jgi:hypothetical protein